MDVTDPPRPRIIATLVLTLSCIRCGEDQAMQVHWWGDSEIAYATAQTMLRSCPVQPDYPAKPLW